ncbi:MAG: inorganic phosphate transporter [Ignavibacteria bacterium]|nr:inorganic phosphate transporter [Ignavibacteria bacterium]
MNDIYLILVIVLFMLAVSDLIVGVSNDAVNFLSSAIGSKSAPFWVIMIVACLGIIVGATFSSGLMEVARKGIFHPEQFYFSEIMIIFLAVMITDVILLDLFNTYGLPTSTTVSIVFELLGAAVAVSVVKMIRLDEPIHALGNYINSEKALAIILGILLSVIIAFSVGALIQYITRIFFSFDYKKYLKYFGALWGGVSITAITYFILIKGAGGSSFITEDTLAWINSNTLMILVVSFICWTILLQLLNWLIKLNILQLIVLVGTFALAMAFAGNDLVNFIGVPLAGLKSFQAFISDPNAVDPNQFSMIALTGKVKTDTLLLLLAGLVMVITLWVSRKARSVTATTVDLSSQGEEQERFGSSFFSRTIVRGSIAMGNTIRGFIPNFIYYKINKRFDQKFYEQKSNPKDEPAFDMVRASVNLVVASILIAIGTSLKLPLSTTYVTFMVAMGTSLADRAWGRESAVFRITGVITVIGGWFFTAMSAFTVAAIFALIISMGGFVAIGVLLILAVFFIIKTHTIHRKREKEIEETKELDSIEGLMQHGNVMEKCSKNVLSVLGSVSKSYNRTIHGLITEDRKQLKEIKKEIDTLNKQTKRLKNNMNKTIQLLHDDSIESGHFYVQVLDYLREIAHSLTFISSPIFDHIDNNHKPLIAEQKEDLKNLSADIELLFKDILIIIKEQKFTELEKILSKQHELLETISKLRKKQVKRIKGSQAGTRVSLLYLEVLAETKNLLLYTINLVKSNRDFVEYSKKPESEQI